MPALEDLYRQKVTELAAALHHADEGQREPARDSLRGFITAIVIPPDGLLQVHGDLRRMLTATAAAGERLGRDAPTHCPACRDQRQAAT